MGFFDKALSIGTFGATDMMGLTGSNSTQAQARRAANAARQAQLAGFNVTGPGGMTATLDFKGGTVNSGYGLGDLDPLRTGLVDFASQQLGQVGQGLPSDVTDANAALTAARGALPADFAAGLANLSGMGSGAAAQAYGQLGAVDPNSILALLRQQAQPYESEALNALQNKLFAQGRLNTSGGALGFREFAKGLGQADLGRQLQANTLSDQLANSAFARFGQTLGLASDLNQAQFQRGVDVNNLGYGRAQEGLSTAQGMATFGNQFQGQQLDLVNAALGGQAAINTQGMQNFQNALNASIARSNAAVGASGAMANAAAIPNPWVQLASGALANAPMPVPG